MRRKKKKVLSFLMALSVFMTGSGIGGASAAIAPDDNTAPEQYTVTLPVYEACEYQYETSHKRENPGADQEIVLQYEPGTQVSFDVAPGDGWSIDKMQLFGNKSEIPLMIANRTVRFSMPEEDVIFRAEFHRLAETDAGALEETQDEELWGNESEDFYGEDENNETEEFFGETEEPWTDASEETEEPRTDASEETEEPCTDASEETEEPWTDALKETEEPWTDRSEETEEQSEDEGTDETESEEAGTLPGEGESEEDPGETEENQKHKTLQQLDTPWDEIVTEEELDTSSEGETEEDAFDKESESESEMEIPEGCYQVVLPKSTEYEISFCAETQWYQPGEEVSFTLEAVPGLEALEISAYGIKDTTAMELTRSLEKDQISISFDEEEEIFHFEMPESDVFLLINTDEAVNILADEDDDPVPDRFKLVVSGVCGAPSILNNGQAASTHKTVVFFESDGSKIVREAYCIQPRLNSPGSGTVYDKDTTEYLDGTAGTQSERRMSKGMFYLYGGPAWGRTIEMTDGSSVNLKAVMDQAGCSSNSHYYTITHYVLSYFYLNGTNWNYNSNYTDVLNAAGVNLVKTLASYIIKMPNPTSYLTVPELQATYRKASDKSVTPSTVYKSFDENTATITLPTGITLVNETTGENFSGKAVINGGDRFHLEADSRAAAGTIQLTLTCKYPVDYQALKLGLKGYQDIGFSYYSGEKQLFLSVTLPEIPKNGTAYVQKLDALSGSTKLLNENYSLAGAVYTVYKDRDCTEKVASLTTDESGRTNQAELESGTYYVKETKASKGYQLDEKLYTLKVVSGETATFTSYEEPIRKKLSVQKYDAETGNPSAQSGSFEGAEYTVYLDETCTKKAVVLTTDKKGHAESDFLPLATYYIKETKAPAGYGLDAVVHRIAMVSGGETSVYPISSREKPVKKWIEIQKYDTLTGNKKPYNGKYSFAAAEYTIYSDAACTKKVETVTTNAAGYAKSSALLIDTYYVKETKAPKGYSLDKIIHKVEISATEAAVYTVKSEETPQMAKIELRKYDKETGAKIPAEGASFEGAQYSVYSDEKCTKEIDIITTNASGYGKSKELPFDTYYVKETKKPNGYELDPTVYQIDMRVSDQLAVYPVTSKEQVIRKPIELQKYDKETGKPAPNNSAVKFAGAQYTIYEDKACTRQVEILTLNDSGYAKSTGLLPGTYYIRETKAPTGYEADTLVHEVTVADDGKKSYQIQSYDPVIRGSLMLMKFLDDRYDESTLQEWIDRGELLGIRFTLTHEDPSVPEKEIVTDQYGYAATKTQELVYGTWTLREDPSTTPEGYAGLKEAKIRITKNGVQVKYVVTNSVQNAMIEIVKKDRQTGSIIPKGGAKFQILDSSGTPVVMPDNLDFGTMTDTFTTNEEGKIYLTKPLKHGTYTLKEIEAPEKYLVADPLVFTVDGAYSYEEPLVVECFDEMQTGRIMIRKKDARTQLPLGEGFRFEIRVAEDITDPMGNIHTMEIEGSRVELKKGTQVAVISTNADGIAQSPELCLGKYEVREIAAGEFYAVSDYVYETELTYDRAEISVEAELFVEDEKTTVIIQKEDSEAADETPLPLAGIRFRIFSARELEEVGGNIGQIPEEMLAALGTEYTTDENGQIEITDLKHSTIYYIYESETLPGYNRAHDLYKISVDADGKIDGQIRYTMKISNQANQVEITKWDITGDRELPGAELTLRDTEGSVIEHWISEETPHRIKGLAAGTYTLTEDRAPRGYAVAETITFTLTDSLEVQQVVMNDEQIQVQISKKDITGQEELPGAALEVRAADGTLMDAWISAKEPHFLNLAAGSYTLTEVAAPEKYAKAETLSFEVRDDSVLQKVEMRDAPIQVQISKQDITTEKELPGAQLTVRDSEGTVIADWTSTEEPHFLNLSAGTYTLTEIAAPFGYCKAETVTFEVTDTAEIQKVIMYDKPIEVEVSKQDITDSKELPGALLTVCDTDGNEIDRWYSGEEPHRIPIACGTYILTEIAAPDYYATAESITFEVKETGEVQKVVMKDAPLQVEISKKTITGEEELPGAVLRVSDLDGKVLETWISEKEPHRIRLKKGTYELTEITAPHGYEVAETIRFTVEDTMEVQKVTMYDKPLPEPETETENETDETESETLKETESETEKQSETEPKKPTTPGIVKTGDPTDFLPPSLGVIAGLVLFAGALASGKRKKKRHTQEQ